MASRRPALPDVSTVQDFSSVFLGKGSSYYKSSRHSAYVYEFSSHDGHSLIRGTESTQELRRGSIALFRFWPTCTHRRFYVDWHLKIHQGQTLMRLKVEKDE